MSSCFHFRHEITLQCTQINKKWDITELTIKMIWTSKKIQKRTLDKIEHVIIIKTQKLWGIEDDASIILKEEKMKTYSGRRLGIDSQLS